jgi:micrococcal nuclease
MLLIALLFGVGCREIGPQSQGTAWKNTGIDSSSITDTGEKEVSSSTLDPTTLPEGDNPCRGPVEFFVDVVFDGDTVWGRVDGADRSIRLIGYDAPETYMDECWSSEATDALEFFSEDKWVWLTFDEECEDDYGRLLAYIHTQDEVSLFVNEQMLLLGEGWQMTISPNDTFMDRFHKAESYAIAKGLGLWGECYE